MPEKNKYRCTRNRNFDMPGCPGATDITARNGHYMCVDSPLAAALEMLADFPGDMLHGFVIQNENSGDIYTWDVTSGLAAYQVDSDPDWNPFTGRHSQVMIDRGKELVGQDVLLEPIVKICTAMSLLRQKDEREQEARKQERLERERIARPPEEGCIWMEGVIHSAMTFSKTVRVQVPLEMKLAYDTWPDPKGSQALKDMCCIVEDEAYETLDGRKVGGWMYEDDPDVESDVIDFEFEEMQNVG